MFFARVLFSKDYRWFVREKLDGTWIAKESLAGTAIILSNFSEGAAMLSKLIYGFALLATALALNACNTIAGAGQDVEKGGQKIQEESREVQRKM
ncbi:MAG TPA: entericidin A/B family lipoprotein [Casimicrobiaceae bacterium]|nr:entericidin A/B family lipoprotein [Casimicrobiaceae bacterium]